MPESVPTFVPAVVLSKTVPEAKPVPRRARRRVGQGRMVIKVGRGRRMVVNGAVGAEALARVLDRR